MMAAIAALSISGLILYGLIVLAEKRTVYWQMTTDADGGAGG